MRYEEHVLDARYERKKSGESIFEVRTYSGTIVYLMTIKRNGSKYDVVERSDGTIELFRLRRMFEAESRRAREVEATRRWMLEHVFTMKRQQPHDTTSVQAPQPQLMQETP